MRCSLDFDEYGTEQSKRVDACVVSWGLPPLIWAAMAPEDDPMPMQLLIQLGHCDPNAKGWFEESVLHVACAYQKYSCVRCVRDRKARTPAQTQTHTHIYRDRERQREGWREGGSPTKVVGVIVAGEVGDWDT